MTRFSLVLAVLVIGLLIGCEQSGVTEPASAPVLMEAVSSTQFGGGEIPIAATLKNKNKEEKHSVRLDGVVRYRMDPVRNWPGTMKPSYTEYMVTLYPDVKAERGGCKLCRRITLETTDQIDLSNGPVTLTKPYGFCSMGGEWCVVLEYSVTGSKVTIAKMSFPDPAPPPPRGMPPDPNHE